MSLAKKTKTALDESRTLMLGAQILLGFQLQAPFQNAFTSLSETQKRIEVVVLCVILFVVGLLIAPSARHRIRDGGEAAMDIIRFITQASIVTQLLFAVALGLDLYLALASIAGSRAGTVAGVTGVLVSVGLWYGPALWRSRKGEVMSGEEDKASTSQKIEYVQTESRVVLPGAQAILGFQLTIILTQGFQQLPFEDQLAHAVALCLIALATALLIAPAAIHRIAYRGEDSPHFYRVASSILLVATVFLALGLSTDLYVVIRKITSSTTAGLSASLGLAAVLFALWHIWPWLSRSRAT